MFKPAWWLPGRHLQTIWLNLVTQKKTVTCKPVILPLADGDELELSMFPAANDSAPVVLLLHGMEGSVQSPGIQLMLKKIEEQGWHAVVMHFRNCGLQVNKTAGFYHAGSSADLDRCVRYLVKLYQRPIAGIFSLSLGANVMVRWLADTPDADKLCLAAVGVSLPLNLHDTAQAANDGFNRFYQHRVLTSYKRHLRRKPEFQQGESRHRLHQVTTMFDFDRDYTAPLHGFNSVESYYQSCSSYQYLDQVGLPTLIINAQNDPIVPFTSALQQAGCFDFPQVEFEYHRRGGHLGFIEGNTPFTARYYPAHRAINFIKRVINKESYRYEPLFKDDLGLSKNRDERRDQHG
jgi:predicted alpha/beta-fold hydrolase